MRFRAVILVALLLAAAARAACPDGFRPIKPSERAQGVLLGTEMFFENAKTFACKKYPAIITPGGLKFWGVVLNPMCIKDTKWSIAYSAASPCGKVSGSFVADTAGPKTYADVVKLWPGTSVTDDWRTLLAPIPCPGGFIQARDAAMLESYLYNALYHKLVPEYGWCANRGFASLSISSESGCLQKKPYQKQGIMAQGVLVFQCYPGTKTFKKGVSVSGEVQMLDRWSVTKWVPN